MHSSSRETFIKLMKELGNSLWWIVISFVLAALTVVLTLYIPVLFGNSIDLMLYTPVDWLQLKGILLKVCVLIVVCAILTWIMNVVNNKVAYGVIRQLRSKTQISTPLTFHFPKRKLPKRDGKQEMFHLKLIRQYRLL